MYTFTRFKYCIKANFPINLNLFMMAILKRDSFGHITIFKKWLIRILGAISHPRFKGINNLNIKGGHIISLSLIHI